MDQSKKLIVFSVENGEMFQQHGETICWLNASGNSPLIQESGKQSTKPSSSNEQPTSINPSSSRETAIVMNALLSDSADRKPLSSYHPNDHDEFKIGYLQKPPCQP